MKKEYFAPSLEILLMNGDILTSSPTVDPDIEEDKDELPWQDW